MTVLAQAYWVHAQLVLLVLDVAPNQDGREFEAIFLRGLHNGFGFAAPGPEFERRQDHLKRSQGRPHKIPGSWPITLGAACPSRSAPGKAPVPVG
jgi:hypothetical protein